MTSSAQQRLLPQNAAAPATSSSGGKRRVLIVGGGLGGLAAARELRGQFDITLIDAKEYFEFTSGIFRAFVEPQRWDEISFKYEDVIEKAYGATFIWGEVLNMSGTRQTATIRRVNSVQEEEFRFDFCIVAGGCGYGMPSSLNPSTARRPEGAVLSLPATESPWQPTVQKRQPTLAPQDERTAAGRKFRVQLEHERLNSLNKEKGNVLIVGAGYRGVAWAADLKHHFPDIHVTVTDFLPRCLGPLSPAPADYCQKYMEKTGIATHYMVKFDAASQKFWQKVGLAEGAQRTYDLSGVRHSNTFMPKDTLSDRGPGGGGWILVNKFLQVTTKEKQPWANGTVFAVGDCNMFVDMATGRSKQDAQEVIPPVPKTGYPAELQAVHACRNIRALDHKWYEGQAYCFSCIPVPGSLTLQGLRATWYPWGAGVFVIPLGPNDGCVIVGATEAKDSGSMHFSGKKAASIRNLIESTKMQQCRGIRRASNLLWQLIEQWPINICGRGPLCGIC
eukprot:TRINITY_DN8987_c2_g1_i1.p1 TRINITY_DN8987_c2_g1~~TRINITY_DN8987_c2_g1_i1.p1  ORF type:complete len:504 (+),score=99.58 TRINITY_DN8987_c2_g1_i1:120-1631(+)